MSRPVACIVGWPVKHSRSPVIHRFWLKELGIDGDYVVQPVEPDQARAFFAGFVGSGYVGANVTVPHKEVAFAAVDGLETAARAIGAVNTLWRDGNRLLGTNTDGMGFLANLDQEAPGWDRNPGEAVVLGAGGAARAVLWALAERGFAPIQLVNRTAARTELLARQFGSAIRPRAWDALSALLPTARLLVNTTSLGMEGQPPLAVDLSPLPADALVTDLVYVPLETPLLAAARLRRLRTVDGLGMLLHQAAPGFERWFGKRPVVTTALRAAVLGSMAAH
jgi:shikimate dehydrogenase